MNVLTRALSFCALVSLAVGVTAGTAFADPNCSPAVPSLGQGVVCTYNAGGSTTVVVPAGTGTITAVLSGAGGGAGGSDGLRAGAAGGAGARVTTVVNASGLTALTLVVGQSGQQGADYNPIPGGGGGGGFSALYPGRLTEPSSVIAVAGGGGGGQGGRPTYVGGDGAAQSTAAGGAGLGTSGCGGGGGADGTGGSGFTDGQSWIAGGAGGSGGDVDAGDGGAGYGGGAEGGICFAGGGAGGSFVDPRLAIGVVTYAPLGATGGSDGFVSLTFNAQTYTVSYDANGGADRVTGTSPVDISSPYVSGSNVTVLGNTGALTRDGYTFDGWNTARNGSGTSYAPTNTFAIGANTILYAQWKVRPSADNTVQNTPAATPTLRTTKPKTTATGVTVTFTAPGPGTATASGTASQATRASVTVCRGTTKILKAGKAVVTCTLNATGRRLRAKGTLTVVLTTTFVAKTSTRLQATHTVVLPRRG